MFCMPCLPSPHRVTVQHGAPEAWPGVGESSGPKAVRGWEVITGGQKEGKNCLTKVRKSLAFQGRTKCPRQRKGLWGQEPFILNGMDSKVQDQATHGSHSLSLGPVVPPGSCKVSKILPREYFLCSFNFSSESSLKGILPSDSAYHSRTSHNGQRLKLTQVCINAAAEVYANNGILLMFYLDPNI